MKYHSPARQIFLIGQLIETAPFIKMSISEWATAIDNVVKMRADDFIHENTDIIIDAVLTHIEKSTHSKLYDRRF